MFNNSGFSMPVVPANGGGLFGGGNGGGDFWGVIVLLLLFGAFNGNGFGFGGFGGNGGYSEVQRGFDNQAVTSKLEGITYGLTDSTFALSNAIKDCCCTTQRAIDGVNYNMATQACDTRNVIQNSTRDILESNNANTRAILDFLTNDKIATLTAENQSLKLAASQATQNDYLTATMQAQTAQLINRINPMPVPAYTVPSPYAYNNCGCGC